MPPTRSTTPGRQRAAALPAAERRAAVVDAALPLLVEHGAGVTTRQIADAAGIAEGTVFRVFADKDELLDAVVARAFDPEPTIEGLEAIDPTRSLDERLVAAVEVFQRRVSTVWRVMAAVGATTPPAGRPAPDGDAPEVVALAAVIAPDRRAIRCEPIAAARLLRGLVFACSHPALVSGDPAPPAEIVGLLLDGLRSRPATPEDRSC